MYLFEFNQVFFVIHMNLFIFFVFI